tara:strand:- start:169 stop:357 length:189 start_codon:yes stop_codon:yes gene_type:complete
LKSSLLKFLSQLPEHQPPAVCIPLEMITSHFLFAGIFEAIIEWLGSEKYLVQRKLHHQLDIS